MAKVTLVGLTYSPWTIRARWALRHHGIKHDFQEYLPVVGEPMLRLKTGNWLGRVSVPVLLTPHGAVSDSIAIARHADSIGKGAKLFDGHEAAVARWTETAEIALDAARGLVLRAIDASPEAQAESVSLPLPRALKGPTARFGTAMIGWKWKARLSESEAESRMIGVLEELRAALGGKKDAYLDGTFSLADVVMAGVVQCIQPVADRFVPVAPATRAARPRPALAARVPDLIEWRDALYEKHASA
ncbi:MAG: glutathione S-transferase N-terminal domain-containing protein [Polyangiales bacterium]